ncbi:hypothetical protein AOC05_12565 [Arthrobacter alpinus]|uniref:Uncharacterized protein n=1 Tax=Arthrobacter alpinus TaxID=656366 RepID=A0A0M5M1Z7_9MICC|nr:hypothetical protein [Arthrobacter alpinus]ALE92937.1 hypothetical protein AOC05_12565 [Arthrobacter alpinus]
MLNWLWKTVWARAGDVHDGRLVPLGRGRRDECGVEQKQPTEVTVPEVSIVLGQLLRVQVLEMFFRWGLGAPAFLA